MHILYGLHSWTETPQGQQALTMLTIGHTSPILSSSSQTSSHGSLPVSYQLAVLLEHALTHLTDGTYIWAPNPGYVQHASGSTKNIFGYSDFKLNTYSRNVSTLNSSVTQDVEDGTLTQDQWPLTAGRNDNAQLMVQGLVGIGRLPGGKGRGF